MSTTYEFPVSPKELDYLKSLASTDRSFADLLKFEESLPGRRVMMRLSRADAAQLREYLMSRMDLVGFDENYEPNEEGQILEDLIDRFFVP